ncbi:MAG: glycoside hydrolase family 3 N-terminal domain-containing protein, partial [Clostridium sp.]
SMEKIGATDNSKNAKNVGLTLGSYLTQYGFNLNFAPVADVNTNPENIVIGKRSFGSNPSLVAEMVTAEIEGLHEAGIMSCVKHFPGHGDTKGDTHLGYVSVEKTWEALKTCELIPFSAAVSENTDMVMVAHITTPNITSDGLPASLSKEIIEERLRKELKYDGIVITDSMAMGAITEEFTSSESAVKAIWAGVDIILMPENFVEAYNGIYDAVNNGVISQLRIDESVLRILSLKEQYGLLK